MAMTPFCKSESIALMMGYQAEQRAHSTRYRLRKNEDTQQAFLLPGYANAFDTNWPLLMEARDFLRQKSYCIEMVNESVKIVEPASRVEFVVGEGLTLMENLFEAIYQVSLYESKPL
jgi:hypothetical protein